MSESLYSMSQNYVFYNGIITQYLWTFYNAKLLELSRIQASELFLLTEISVFKDDLDPVIHEQPNVAFQLTFIDMLSYCIWVNVPGADSAPRAVRWSRPLRPLLLINFPEGRHVSAYYVEEYCQQL